MTNAKGSWLRGEPYFGSGSTLLIAGATIALSYFVPHLVGTMTTNPQTVWPLWPGCAILVTGLLLVRIDVWPVVIPASFVGFAVADFQAGVPLSSIARFIPGNTLEVLISAVGLRYCFDGVPRLNSVRALAKYSFFAIILGPLAGAFFSAHGVGRNYWTGWKIVALSEVLAFTTLTPALLSWVSEGRSLMRRSRAHRIEGMALIAGLILVSYVVFTVREDSSSPALFYTLVPFLLWSALRFGWLGVSTSLIVVTSLSIWGAVYGRGPFSNFVPLTDPLPLQMFLVFASVPFMVLAALAEEREEAARVVRESEERLRLAQSAAHVGTFDLNLRTGMDIWQPETEALFGLPPGGFGGTLTAFEDLIHPDDRKRIRELTQEMLRTGRDTDAYSEYRVVWPDGSVHWIAGRGRLVLDESGKPMRMIGVNMDITERKRAEEALRASEERLRLAAVAGKMFAYEWDAATDVISRSADFSQVLGKDEPTETTGQQVLGRTHPDDRERVNAAVASLSPTNPRLRISYRMSRQDGSFLWVERTSRAHFDEQGRMLRLVGMLADVTERREAELALADMTRKLIGAQEQERTRIARDLHDDIAQRLALVNIDLQEIESTAIDDGLRKGLGEIRQQVDDVVTNVQALSHELYSSKLQYLGLFAAVKGFCAEFQLRQRAEIEFSSHDVPTDVSQEISLCLFRILQQALHNAAKHSGVRHFEVRLFGTPTEIHLSVSDLGIGFDVEEALKSQGIGLMSMKERMRLVGGALSIDSQPKRGTTIHARVPFRSSRELARAAG